MLMRRDRLVHLAAIMAALVAGGMWHAQRTSSEAKIRMGKKVAAAA